MAKSEYPSPRQPFARSSLPHDKTDPSSSRARACQSPQLMFTIPFLWRPGRISGRSFILVLSLPMKTSPAELNTPNWDRFPLIEVNFSEPTNFLRRIGDNSEFVNNPSTRYTDPSSVRKTRYPHPAIKPTIEYSDLISFAGRSSSCLSGHSSPSCHTTSPKPFRTVAAQSQPVARCRTGWSLVLIFGSWPGIENSSLRADLKLS